MRHTDLPRKQFTIVKYQEGRPIQNVRTFYNPGKAIEYAELFREVNKCNEYHIIVTDTPDYLTLKEYTNG